MDGFKLPILKEMNVESCRGLLRMRSFGREMRSNRMNERHRFNQPAASSRRSVAALLSPLPQLLLLRHLLLLLIFFFFNSSSSIAPLLFVPTIVHHLWLESISFGGRWKGGDKKCVHLHFFQFQFHFDKVNSILLFAFLIFRLF